MRCAVHRALAACCVRCARAPRVRRRRRRRRARDRRRRRPSGSPPLGARRPTSPGSARPSSPTARAPHHRLARRSTQALAWAAAQHARRRPRRRAPRAGRGSALGARRRSARASCGRSTGRWRCSASAAASARSGALRAPVVAFDEPRRAARERGAARRHDRLRQPPHAALRRGARRSGLPRWACRRASTPRPRPPKRGALAVLVRSVTAISSRTPHTGALAYDDGVPQDPGRGRLDRGRRPARATGASRTGRGRADRSARSTLAGRAERQRRRRAARAGAAGRDRAARRAHRFVGRRPGRVRRRRRLRRGDGSASPAARKRARAAANHPRGPLHRRGVRPRGRARRISNGTAASITSPRSRPTTAWRAPDAIGVGSEERARAMAPLLPAFARFGIRRFRPHAFGADVQPIVETRRGGVRPRAGRPPLLRHPPHRRRHARQVRPEDLRRNAAAIALLAYLLAER